jgi:3-hydroxybutyryl-CoA dehydrogenase
LAQAQENGEEIDPASIDKILTASGFKMGPFQLMDLIGMDINYGVSQIVYDALGQHERLKPSPIQAQKVADGHLGKKSGKGFYEYPPKP